MRSNEELQKDILDAIKWEPLLHAAEIGVTVKDGIVTLTGEVDSYAKKLEAEVATKNVAGVKAIVEKIDVKFGSANSHDDAHIASGIVQSLNWNWAIPNDKVKVKVEDGWVTLQGDLSNTYQKEEANNTIKNLVGVKGITNNISINPESINPARLQDINQALARNWSINSDDIDVNVMGNKVQLTGTVKSMYQREEAAKIVRNAPGVNSVENQLLVEYPY